MGWGWLGLAGDGCILGRANVGLATLPECTPRSSLVDLVTEARLHPALRDRALADAPPPPQAAELARARIRSPCATMLAQAGLIGWPTLAPNSTMPCRVKSARVNREPQTNSRSPI